MQEIQGFIEDILFKNDENGYVVAKIRKKKELITIVGCMPYITEGQNLKLKGEWVIHPQFGNQFKVEVCEEIVPDTVAGIERYLSSGIISGIGPVTAKKIVKKFGEETLNILDSNIERLTEIEGIGKKKIEVIYDSYIKQNEVRNIMMFFQNYGVTPNQCMKVYKRFGENSISIVKENPYILTEEIRGIGFKTADKIARSLGIASNSPFRIQSGINYIINGFCSLGNTYMPLEKLVSEAMDILGVREEEIHENIYNNIAENKLKIEKVKEQSCVFTLPYYYCELGVTKKILSLSLSQYDNLNINIEDEIASFEKNNNIKFHDSQREAIKGALENGVEIITGGPGTGKTTIINCITEIFEKANMKVYMAAPTGRAAKRMSETTGREAKTIHRMLEMGVSEDDTEEVFSKGEETPLECDVVIIDEASMIDIILMNTLLKAIALGTRIIIVGDVDQLPSVGPGNVLRDLIESKCVKVVRLKEIFRQSKESMIIVNAHRINDGEMPIINKKDKDFYFIECSEPKKIVNTLLELSNRRLPKFNKSWHKIHDIQILSPMRKGVLGVSSLNKELQSVLNPKNDSKKEMEFKDYIFRVGDKVMQTKNNYSLKWTRASGEGEAEGLGIFNGDVGYIEDIDEEKETIQVLFDNERRVIYENLYLDEIDLAYAVTIHKSQGSEFPVVIMPAFKGPPLLMNRNLLYTGITRAKRLVVLVGSLKSINFMVQNDKIFERYSLLKWRISNILDTEIINGE
ncbi:ATP-dependent RecD-like DNA helicase [Clostridium botulinum]|uniref:SF1B family DNA helicase RecD2 n=1 Tax=Clostridium botulinum TaxID=1491 RepID=UPI0007E10038|nr:ATP-dependent RecD-like DNA helicase [Clostridium botulinum]KEI93267.1 ATPase AAA [Clostridium botulinum B2 267]MBN3410165.1 ATP-dependent RecD-like DNA helicase [Clostridium botulinum]MBY6797419.1 ATP-dependent RecD-like DNA helicase [Clostridium botulinum]MBY6867590.1 ATP-dependent RecD-like DNA helicase [Clostridium botulinum]MBY6874140.1 ATP-dependent RecD-like DNA helicase [Clostridium botulinum]